MHPFFIVLYELAPLQILHKSTGILFFLFRVTIVIPAVHMAIIFHQCPLIRVVPSPFTTSIEHHFFIRASPRSTKRNRLRFVPFLSRNSVIVTPTALRLVCTANLFTEQSKWDPHADTEAESRQCDYDGAGPHIIGREPSSEHAPSKQGQAKGPNICKSHMQSSQEAVGVCAVKMMSRVKTCMAFLEEGDNKR